MALYLLSIEWNMIGLGGHAHGIVTNTVHKTLPEGGGGKVGLLAREVVARIDSNFGFVLIVNRMVKEMGGWQRGWWGPRGWNLGVIGD